MIVYEPNLLLCRKKKHNDNWVKAGECYHRVYFMYKTGE